MPRTGAGRIGARFTFAACHARSTIAIGHSIFRAPVDTAWRDTQRRGLRCLLQANLPGEAPQFRSCFPESRG